MSTLKVKKITELGIREGQKKVIEIKFYPFKYEKDSKIVKRDLRKYFRIMKGKLTSKGKQASVQVCVKLEDGRYRSGKITDLTDEPSLYDDSYYQISGQEIKSVRCYLRVL